MSKKIVDAWKNEEHRLSLTADERASLPENPAGIMELTDEALDDLIAGGDEPEGSCCWGSCAIVVEV